LPGTQFVTVNGFRNSTTLENITELEGGMIYTIKMESLVVKPEHFSPQPAVIPLSVDVTVDPVTWGETEVSPNL